MRLIRLELRRYGHLSDVVLEFPPEASLCVVHGANEAGKSTALAALGDALFGFRDVRSGPRPDFLHGAPQLRVGLTLRARNGEQVAIVRRKGRANTLTDDAGNPLPDDAIGRLLGGAGRDTFENTFGLNGARLREGGKVLAQGGGHVGESLFAAGTGLLGLRTALQRLDEEAKTLVGRANAPRRLNVAVERWRQAQKEIERLSVAPRAWTETDAAHAEAVAKLAELNESVAALRREESLLQRMRRVAPLLVKLEAARGAVAELADAPRLPTDSAESLRELCAARDEALRNEEREEAEAVRLAVIRDGLIRRPALMVAQDMIDRLAEQRQVVVQAEADRPAVMLEVARLRALVAEATAELGLESTPEAARDALPLPAARRAVERLITRHAGLIATEAAALSELDLAAQRRADAQAALEASLLPTDPAPLRLAIDQARSEGRLDEELGQARSRADRARQRAANALTALPRWAGPIGDLAARALPLAADEADMAVRLAAAETKVRHVREEYDRRAAETRAEEDRLAGFGPDDSIPTPDVVQAARGARDEAWRTIRNRLEGGAPPATGDSSSKSLSATFEALQADADQVADRRADDAQRVADYLQTRIRLTVFRARGTVAVATLAEAEAELAKATAAWLALWSSVMGDAGSPAAMAEWRRARDKAIELETSADDAERSWDSLRSRREAARNALSVLVPEIDGAPTLTAALAQADLICTRREKAAETHRSLHEAAVRATAALATEEAKVTSARAALDAWQTDWTDAVALLGLGASCGVAGAEAALAWWARIAEAAPVWRSEEARVEQMTRAIETFAADVGAAMAAMEADVDEPPLVAAARLARELREARAAEQRYEELSDRIGGHARAVNGAKLQQAGAETRIGALQALAHAVDVAGLEVAIARARSREQAEVEAERLLLGVMEQGDGFDEAALRLSAAHYDPDGAAARLDSIGEDLRALDEQREQWAAKRSRIEATLEAMQEGQDAAAAAQEAHHALADAQAAAERYARVHVARELLRSGIDRFRRSQQGPLLQAASRHFTILTCGRYERLAVDKDKDGTMRMLALRDDGSECPVDQLSEGTADQLYLALRVAMVEAQSIASEPLPLIADDLLVHFDDSRAAAAIRLLTEVGRTTQVILFSHHDHVVQLAKAMARPEVATIRLATVVGQTALAEGNMAAV
jgi:chromosome segregation protein